MAERTNSPNVRAVPHEGIDREWWKEAVVYQIYPWSFNDSDGDGVGDLRGIVEKLDYLEELGVDVVWLTPVYESPGVDNGYDIADYRAIHDRFGSMRDWEDLLEGLHERDIRLIMDLAVNHTSDEHEWFQASRSDPDSPYGDYYVWRDGTPATDATDSPGPADREPPNNWESHFGGSAWAWDDERGAYYLHLYHERQPDLNWENPDVREEIHDVMRWWLDRGIDGFRLDVINVVSKPQDMPDGDPTNDWVGSEHFVNGPRVEEIFEGMDREVFSDYDAMIVGEMPRVSIEQAQRYAGPDGPLDMVFNFDHMRLDFGDGGRWDVGDWTLPEMKTVLSAWQVGLADSAWPAVFFENHDQPRVVSRFGSETHRYESATALATLLLTLRGTPFVYQGQELGMTNRSFESLDDLRDVDTIQHALELMDERGVDYEEIRHIVEHRTRDNARTPMHWHTGEHGGFTSGDPWLPVNPNYRDINVADATDDPGSVLNYYRRLVDLRHESDTIVYGDYQLLLPDHGSIYAYTRNLNGETLLVVLNVDDDPTTEVIPGFHADATLLLGNYGDVPQPPDGALDLRPYEARIYRL